MSFIDPIKEQAAFGYKQGEIAKKLKLDIKTVKKHLAKEDFSPAPPLVTDTPSKIDPYKGIIGKWLEEDKENWYKQPHTAKRIMEWLSKEQPGSTVLTAPSSATSGHPGKS